MFQVESRAQMSSLPRMMPRGFTTSWCRWPSSAPAPSSAKWCILISIAARAGKRPIVSIPRSNRCCAARSGVPLFQEQLLRMAMIAAGFTGGEAEELRRAMGFKRSEKRMADIEVKLRAGMTRNGITGKPQDDIVRSITSFALYGFPESHAASFALLAYASAYLKCHYLAAFTCAMLNNQPMGFYSPAILIKDAQRHGLRVLPVDIVESDWNCTVQHSLLSRAQRAPRTRALASEGVPVDLPAIKVDEAQWGGLQSSPKGPPGFSPIGERNSPDKLKHVLQSGQPEMFFNRAVLRLGLRYARGLREEAAQAILRARTERPFSSVDDLALRVRELRKDELNRLAEIGALNSLGAAHCDNAHRRDALWQTQRAILPVGPLLAEEEEIGQPSPLAPMNTGERLFADYHGTGLTIGKHPMAYRRAEMDQLRVTRAADLARVPNGRLRAHRRIGDRAPASRHRQGFRLPQHGRRDRHHERHPHATHIRPLQTRGPRRTFPADRWRPAKSGWSDLRESRARASPPARRRRRVARFLLSGSRQFRTIRPP